jgi:two-component system, sensor histidine kinase PdtaS
VDAPPLDVPILDLTLSLALAVVAASKAPMLLLDSDFRVVAASNSFGRAFDVDVSNLREPSIFSLGRGEWDKPRLLSFLEATLCGDAEIEQYEFDLERPGQPTRCLVLHADKLVYGDLAPPRGLLAITDVTEARDDARRKDELAQHNAVLLQEVRHRVANSLQIIASVLLQSARNTQSEEARGQLRNAHLRLMSVASLERHLTTVTVGDVDLSAYLKKLCASIAASMVHKPGFRLNVSAEGVFVDPDTSVSIGLMVTELVMNALKHAFNGRESGEIDVSFSYSGDGWTLTVADNGVGIDPAGMKAGLGTSIVEALAKQLRATVQIMQGNPGTKVILRKPPAGS